MRFTTFIFSFAFILIFGFAWMNNAYAQEENGWVKYFTWEGDIDEMVVFRVQDEVVKADYPVGSGFKNAKVTFFAGDPGEHCAAKIEVHEGRGSVAIVKQCWQPPEPYLKIQIYDKPKGFGHYKLTVYYLDKELSAQERKAYMKEINKAVYEYDIYHMERELARNNLTEALRWARSAYEIDRLNWDILNRIGAIYYKMGLMDKAEDVFVILRDYGYLTEDNKTRFKEIAPYEYRKLEQKEKKEGEEEDEEEEEDEGGESG